MYNDEECHNRMIIISDNIDYDYCTGAPWTESEESDMDLDSDYDEWNNIVASPNVIQTSSIVQKTANLSLNPARSSSGGQKKKSKSKRKNKQAKKKQSMPQLDDAAKDDTETQEAKAKEVDEEGTPKALEAETNEDKLEEAAGPSEISKKPKPKT